MSEFLGLALALLAQYEAGSAATASTSGCSAPARLPLDLGGVPAPDEAVTARTPRDTTPPISWTPRSAPPALVKGPSDALRPTVVIGHRVSHCASI